MTRSTTRPSVGRPQKSGRQITPPPIQPLYDDSPIEPFDNNDKGNDIALGWTIGVFIFLTIVIFLVLGGL